MVNKPEIVRPATQGQVLELAGTVSSALPTLSFYQAEILMGRQRQLRDVARRALREFLVKLVPEVGVRFRLSPEEPWVDPMKMAFSRLAKGWTFHGDDANLEPGLFKLVKVGHRGNLWSLRDALAEQGSLPQGQWLEVFRQTFPILDGVDGVIGVADGSWHNSQGQKFFPLLRSDGVKELEPIGRSFDDNWTWLVGVD